VENQGPIIIALDFNAAEQARALVRRLGDQAGFYKVGLELFTGAGPDFVRELVDSGKRVFLDLKFYDIGETVKRATDRVSCLGATFLTIHGSPQIMRAAHAGRQSSTLKLLAVTVLTSLDDDDLLEAGYVCGVRDLAGLVVRKALETGIDGVVASPREAVSIRTQAGDNLILLTPGIRSAGAASGDQKRTATPAEALEAGADYLVIGRQVTRAADPVAAVGQIREEIARALAAQ
jgi:orotidine-5'-phosphate decarboxylase